MKPHILSRVLCGVTPREQRFTAICVQCGQRIEWGNALIARIVRHLRKYNHESVKFEKATDKAAA